VDDGSSDNTNQVIHDLGKSEKIVYQYQENQGRSKARNYGLQIASGEYITFLDSDDIYLPNKLQIQVEYLDSHPDIGMVYSSAACEDEFGNLLAFQYLALTQGHIYKQIAFYIPVTIILPTVMVRREIIQEVGYFDESLNRFEDTDYWRRISRLCLIGAIPQVLCRIRSHSGNTLTGQNPVTIVNDVKKYVDKVLHADANEASAFLRRGSCRLYFHYRSDMIELHDPQWSNASKELKELAFKSDGLEFIRLECCTYFQKKITSFLKRMLSDRLYLQLRNFYRFAKHVNKED